MDVLNEWFQLDEILRKNVQNYWNDSHQKQSAFIRNHPQNDPPILHDPVFLSGSTAEVGALCRCVSGDDVEVEYDLMFTHGCIKDRTVGDNMLIPVEGHPGYFYMRGCPDGSLLFPVWRDVVSSIPEGH